MKKIKVLVASALVLSSITVLAGCGNSSKGEELALADSNVEESSNEEVVEEKAENAEEVKEETKEEVKQPVAEEVKKEEVKAKSEAVKENKSTASTGTSSSSNSKNSTSVKNDTAVKNNTQPKKETPNYRIGEVIPAPDGEVYEMHINGAHSTTNVRRLINNQGTICSGGMGSEFSESYKIQDSSVIRLLDEFEVDDTYSKQYYGLDRKLKYRQFKGLRQGRTKITITTVKKETGEVRDYTDYYIEVDANLNVYVFLPGNGIEN